MLHIFFSYKVYKQGLLRITFPVHDLQSTFNENSNTVRLQKQWKIFMLCDNSLFQSESGF